MQTAYVTQWGPMNVSRRANPCGTPTVYILWMRLLTLVQLHIHSRWKWPGAEWDLQVGDPAYMCARRHVYHQSIGIFQTQIDTREKVSGKRVSSEWPVTLLPVRLINPRGQSSSLHAVCRSCTDTLLKSPRRLVCRTFKQKRQMRRGSVSIY